MKRTLTVVPALVVAGLAVGATAQPASADVLPLPLPTTGTVLDTVTGTVTTTAGSLLPTASPLPVPLPTSSPLPTTAPLPLPVPVPSESALPSTAPVSGTLTKPTKTVHQQSAGGTTVQPGTAADLADSVANALTGTTPGVQLSSASAPAWASALMGSTAFPSFPARGGTAVVPMAISGTRSGSTKPTDVPGLLTATAVLSLLVAAGGQALARSGRV